MDNINQELEKRRYHYQILIDSTIPIEKKMNELRDLDNENLITLLGQFEANEEYEICQVIKTVLDEKTSS